MRRLLQRLFQLSNRQSIVVISSATILTVIVLNTSISVYLAVLCYAFASYALVSFILLIVRNFGDLKRWVKNWHIWQEIRKHPFGEKLLDDVIFRTKLGLYFGALINGVYVIVKLMTGIIYKSNWLEELAIYYFILAVMRYTIIVYEKRNGIHTESMAVRFYRQ